MVLPIKDRVEAGRALGEAMKSYRDREDVLVLSLPGAVSRSPVKWLSRCTHRST